MWCPSCGAEYRPGIDRCTDCGVDLTTAAVPSASLHALGRRLVDALVAYENRDGEAPLDDVILAGPWRRWFVASESVTTGTRPANRWTVVLQRDEEWVVIVGVAGGGWEITGQSHGLDMLARVLDRAPWLSRFFDREPTGSPNVGAALAGVPWGLWLAVGGTLAVAIAWLALRDAPTELRVLAGVSAGFVAVVVVAVVPRSMRTLLVRMPGIVVYAAIVVLTAYLTIGAAEGLHVGWAWPVNAWLDLFEKDAVVVDVLDDKRIEHHEHCGRYGCSEEDHYWITVGGREWPVSQAAYDVLRDGEVVEIAYKPRTSFVLYVAYGPALSSTREADELRVAVTLDPSEREVFEESVLPQFKRRTGLEVTFLQMEPDTLMEVLDEGSGSPFDLVAVDNNKVGQLAEDDLVQDLTADANLIPGQVIPSMLPVTEVDGRTLFFPFRPNVMITYYDGSQLGELGVAPPMSWDELLDAAAELDAAGSGLVLQGAPGAPSATQLVELLWQAGGDPLDLDSPGSREALSFLHDLASHLDGDTAEAKFDTVNTFLADGDTALAPNWTFGVSEVVVKEGRRDVLAYPGWSGPAGEAHVLGGDVLAIPKRAERRGAALDLAEYLMSRPVQATLAAELFWPSIRTDAYTDVTPELRPYWDAINDAMAHATPRPAVACWSQVEEVLSDVWHQVVDEQANPGELADRWDARMDEVCMDAPGRGESSTSAPTTTVSTGNSVDLEGPCGRALATSSRVIELDDELLDTTSTAEEDRLFAEEDRVFRDLEEELGPCAVAGVEGSCGQALYAAERLVDVREDFYNAPLDSQREHELLDELIALYDELDGELIRCVE